MHQQIIFTAPPIDVQVGSSFELQATATSGLPIEFAINDPSVANIYENKLTFLSEGTLTVTATQFGNETYLSAEPVKYDINVTVISGNISSIEQASFSVYPNPTAQWINVSNERTHS